MSQSDKKSRSLDLRLTPDRLASAIAGWLQMRLALTGPDTRIAELVLTAQAYDLLAQSGWMVQDEFSADILDQGTKYKRLDLFCYKTIDKTSSSPRPKLTSEGHVFEIKILNNKHKATESFQRDLATDAARLALFGERYSNCQPTQLVIVGVGSLAGYVQRQKNRITDSLERWAPLWGAMGRIASPEEWSRLAEAKPYSKLKEGEELQDFQHLLGQYVGLFGGEGSKSAAFDASVLRDGLGQRADLQSLRDVLGSKSIKYDRGFVSHVRCPGSRGRVEDIGLDDYLVFTVRVRAV